MDRSTDQTLRDLADRLFEDVWKGAIPMKAPDFQIEIEKRIERWADA